MALQDDRLLKTLEASSWRYCSLPHYHRLLSSRSSGNIRAAYWSFYFDAFLQYYVGVGAMAKNEKNRVDLLKSVELWILAVLLVLILSAAFYHMGFGVLGLLIGIVLVLRLFMMTGRGGSRWGL
jgi:NADH:ubiquinone oxidoreductase subunit K